MNLLERQLECELMDDPDLDQHRHANALKGLRRINWFSGTAGLLASTIAKRFPSSSSSIRILDLACGGGDVTLHLAKRLRQLGLNVEITGWDRSPTAVEIARRSAEELQITGVRFEVHDVLADEMEGPFDVVQSTLFLHHLTRSESSLLIGKMWRSAKRLVLIDDLRRTRSGLWLAHLACNLLTRSQIVRVDGPMSVRAAYREEEILEIAKEAGVVAPTIRRHWPQRFLLEWSKP